MEIGLMGQRVNAYTLLLESSKFSFTGFVPFFIPSSSILTYLIPHGLSNRVYCLAWILSNLIVEKQHLGVVLFCIYFIVSKTEYIFLCLRTTWLSFSVYSFFISLATLRLLPFCVLFLEPLCMSERVLETITSYL